MEKDEEIGFERLSKIKEGFMKRGGILIIFIAMFFSLTGSQAFALPTLQTYIDGATAVDYGLDQDTWLYTGSDTFSLYVVGAYGPNTVSLEGVTLLISIPDGETGTISFSTSDETPILLTITGAGSSSETNPTENADISILDDVSVNSGYSTINSSSFLPEDLNLNNHYPLEDDVSDFLIFDLDSFDKEEINLNDYNADDGGIISPTSAIGEQKEYLVTITGFSWVHFDAYGLETDQLGNKVVTTWENNPGSHDATAVVPEPSTLLLLGFGLIVIGVYGWRRMKKQK